MIPPVDHFIAQKLLFPLQAELSTLISFLSYLFFERIHLPKSRDSAKKRTASLAYNKYLQQVYLWPDSWYML